jgi:hypothetical protein
MRLKRLLVISACILIVVCASITIAYSRAPRWYRMIQGHITSKKSEYRHHVYEPAHGTDPRNMVEEIYDLSGIDPETLQTAIDLDCPQSAGWRSTLSEDGFLTITTSERYPDRLELIRHHGSMPQVRLVFRREAYFWENLGR